MALKIPADTTEAGSTERAGDPPVPGRRMNGRPREVPHDVLMAEYIEFGTQDGKNVTRTGRIDRDAIVGLAVTGQAPDGAVTIDAATPK